MNLNDLFAIAHRRFPQKLALEYRTLSPDEDSSSAACAVTYTYAELFESAERWAASLQAWGLRKGDRVAFYLNNSPQFVIAYLAVIRLGAVMVPINLRYRRREICHMLADSTPRLLITERAQEPILAELTDAEKECLEAVWVVDGESNWLSTVNGLKETPTILGEDLALIMYTSGTTGRSKGAMLSHNNVLASVTGLLTAWAWQADDVLLLPLPLFHTHGLTVGLHCALAAGATVRLRSRFDADETIDELGNGQATLFFGVPTLYLRLLERLHQLEVPKDFSNMRLFCSGSAPLAAETFATFRKETGHTILERYGMTETGMNFSNPYAGRRRPGTVGTPLPGVFSRIVDERGRDVAIGEEGELFVRGSNVFDGYWKAPDKTSESFSHDEQGNRWFHTGDLARQDPETGYVTLLGRRHELIISGGFNIYPREVEELLVTYPGVQEAAVVGHPHPEWGETPVAYLVAAEAIDEEGLIDYCKSQLAGFKVPREVHYVEALPRNAMGKIQKHRLKSDPAS